MLRVRYFYSSAGQLSFSSIEGGGSNYLITGNSRMLFDKNERNEKMGFEYLCVVFFDEYSLYPCVNSARTTKFHGENIRAFEIFLKERFPGLLLNFSPTKDTAKAYLKYMVQKGLAKATIEGRIKTIRVLSRVLAKAGLIEDFAYEIRYRVKNPAPIVPFSELQIHLLFKNIENKKPLGMRLGAYIKLSLDNGIRVSEAHNLNVGDVNFMARTIFLRKRKSGRQQFLPFGIDTAKSLIKYMNAFHIDPSSGLNDPLFQTESGDRWAIRSIQNDLKTLGKKANLQGVRCSPHTLRHSFAINSLMNGMHPNVLQKLLDHSTMDMINRYLHITNELQCRLYVSPNDAIIKRGHS